jgi:uncharacterized damage-inducible protein DinB
MTNDIPDDAQERADLIEALDAHRRFLRYTLRDLDDEQSRRRTTVSQLTLAGIVKHVAAVERRWTRFIIEGPASFTGTSDGAIAEHEATFDPGDETLASLLASYDATAEETNALVRTIPSLDDSQPLPPAPWFQPGARRTARRTFLHLIAETAQHAGHADIIREALDGAKTMG